MIINETNRERITKEIEKAEGRAKERRIKYEDILKAIATIEHRLNIPKKHMTGIEADVDIHAQNFPNAYKWRAESTQFTLIRKVSGWDLVKVERYYTRREGHQYKLELTAEAEKAIIESMRDF